MENSIKVNFGKLYDSGFKVIFLENNYILTHIYQSSFKIINIETEECTKVIHFNDFINDFQLTKDGKTLFLSTFSGIHAFEINTGNPVIITPDKNYLETEDFFQNTWPGIKFVIDATNKYLIVAGNYDILIWDLKGKKLLKKISLQELTNKETRQVWNICIDNKNERIAIRYTNPIEESEEYLEPEYILVLSIPSLEFKYEFKINDNLIKVWDELNDVFSNLSTEFNPKNSDEILFMIPFEDTIYSLNLVNGEFNNSFSIPLPENKGTESKWSGIYNFYFSDDKEWVVTRSADYLIFWNLKNGKPIKTIKTNYDASINKDKSLIALFSTANTIMNKVEIYDMKNDNIIKSFRRQSFFIQRPNYPIHNIKEFVPLFVTNDRKQILLNYNILNTFENKQFKIKALEIINYKNEKLLGTIYSYNKNIKNKDQFSCIIDFFPENGNLFYFDSYSETGDFSEKYLALIFKKSYDHFSPSILKIYDIKNTNLLFTKEFYNEENFQIKINKLRFINNTQVILSGYFKKPEGNFLLYDIEKDKIIRYFFGEDWRESLEIINYQSFASLERKVNVWNINQEEPIFFINKSPYFINSIPEKNQLLLFYYPQNYVEIYDTNTFEKIREIKLKSIPKFSGGKVKPYCISPDGNTLVVITQDFGYCFYDLNSGSEIGKYYKLINNDEFIWAINSDTELPPQIWTNRKDLISLEDSNSYIQLKPEIKEDFFSNIFNEKAVKEKIFNENDDRQASIFESILKDDN